MNLALAEMRRTRGRFTAITASLALIVFLVLTLGGIGDGLFYGGTGAVRSSTATAYAFADDAPGSLSRSRMAPTAAAQLAEVPGVRAATPLATFVTSVTPAGAAARTVVVIGYEPTGTPVGLPATLAEGRFPRAGEVAAVADRSLRDEAGVSLGDPITIGGVALPVVGFAEDAQYSGITTIWTGWDAFGDIRAAARPETAGQPLTPNTVALSLTPAAAASIDALRAPAGTVVLSNEDTYLSIPGIREQASSLQSIVIATLVVAGLVVALFFALVVLEKRELFASLKAVGASSRKLGGGVVLQALLTSSIAVVTGALLTRLVGSALPESIPVLFRTETLITSGVLTVGAGVLGALFSLRRISRIDPATALGGAL